MYYIYENDKPNKLIEFFNIIQIMDNRLIIPMIPTANNDKTIKNVQKIALKTVKILNKINCNKVVLSKSLNNKNKEIYRNCLYSNNVNVVDGKWLFELLAYDCLEYILDKENKKIEDTEVSIAINDITEISMQNIKRIIKDFKRVNIVTNHISKFKNLEKEIFDESGIMIAVLNNKRKSLAKAKLILNVDFPTELINKYNIYDEACIINLKTNVSINKKRFNGININDFEISYNNENKNKNDNIEYNEIYDKFYNKHIYESGIYKKQPFVDILRKIKKDNVKIDYLVGNNYNY